MTTIYIPPVVDLPSVEAKPLAHAVGAGEQLPAPTVGVADPAHAHPWWVVSAYVVVAAAWLGAVLLGDAVDPQAPSVVPGLSVLAGFYVVAQAIERLLEPVSRWFGSAGVSVTTEGKVHSDVKSIKVLRAESIRAAATTGDQGAADVAARAQQAIDELRKNRGVILWSVASAIAMVLAASSGLYLLHAVGVGGVPVNLDILVTGLAVGGGTKPLHDLISSLQASKEKKEDPARV